MHNVDFNTVLSVIIAAVFGPWFAWFAIKALRDGKTGPKKLPALRSANPFLFWTYLAGYCAIAVMFVAFAVFMTTYDPKMTSERTMIALLVAIFCGGFSSASVAGVVGYYIVQGFCTGTSVVFGRGGVFYSDRASKPVSFWFDQLFNVLFAAFFGTIGFGGIGLSLWFACGAPALW